MNLCRLLGNSTIGLCASAFLLMSGAGIASADRVVNANQPVVIADDVTNRVTVVESASGGPDGGSSGLGDGTNPGQGSGVDNSPSEGTDNPNQSPDS